MRTLVPTRTGSSTRELQEQLELATRVVDWLARRGLTARFVNVSSFSSKPVIEIDPPSPASQAVLQGHLTIERNADSVERRYFVTSAVNGCVVQWKA